MRDEASGDLHLLSLSAAPFLALLPLGTGQAGGYLEWEEEMHSEIICAGRRNCLPASYAGSMSMTENLHAHRGCLAVTLSVSLMELDSPGLC